MSEFGFFAIDVEGNTYGILKHERLKSAKWYQKFFAFFSKKYKANFADLHPFESYQEMSDNLTEEEKLKLPSYFPNQNPIKK